MKIKDEKEIYKCDYREQWIFDDLYVLINNQIKNNTYIIKNKNEAIIIDPSFNGKKVIKFLKDNKIQHIVILITHGHFDHVGQSVEVAEHFNCKIYIHEKDLELKTKYQTKYFEFLDEKDNLFKKFVSFKAKMPKLPLKNFNVKILETPGHTPGSVCYLINNYVFTGDFIFDVDIGRTDFEYSDKKLMTQSLKKFINNFKNKNFYMFPGHEEWTKIDDLKIINPFVKNFFK
ncbi:MBL fold metallo-hydrolase [Mycoplasmoides pirum]|uniref:MBL fold metallo-hydrolase n=1 Tax=Mycoplasmoides pirum TaxID=2122 RepID=UPI0004852D6C|nr:MBL fold metallo-hydrolase [Mycoplasmoides pirum]